MFGRLQQVAAQLAKSNTSKSENAGEDKAMSSQPEITLYTGQTPNGVKISIALELLGIPYKTVKIALSKLEQKEPWFLNINPNGRIPAITDHKPPFNDGKELHIMESGAILLYLAENYDPEHKISFEKGSREHWEMVQWVLWQNAGLGPMQGQSNHFTRYAPEKIPYAINRYQTEGRRLYSILNTRLEERASNGCWIVGDHISIADVTCWGWASSAAWAGIDLEEFEHVKKWFAQMEALDAVEKGRNVPEPSELRAIMADKEKMDEHAAKSSAWILKGMEEDAKK